MSDDDMGDDDEHYSLEYSEDSSSEPDVDLENQYYNSKALKEDNPQLALESFKRLMQSDYDKGEWAFKALKQMVKIHFKMGNFKEMLVRYDHLLGRVQRTKNKNYSEKTINSILDYVASSQNDELLQDVYANTLESLRDADNINLWFLTNIKLGKLYFDRKEFEKLEIILKQLRDSCLIRCDEEDLSKPEQLLAIYALEIQMYTVKKNNKKLKALYKRSLQIRSTTAQTHPLIIAVIFECGGKMHLREQEFDNATTDFFEAFKNYDECGNPRRTACLKYLILANMLMKSDINPFDSPEAKPFKTNPEILVMINLLAAYQNNAIFEFENILTQNRKDIMEDPFIKEHIDELLLNIRSQVLIKLLKPYTRIRLAFVAEALNVDVGVAENLLVSFILDEQIEGRIDQVTQVLELRKKETVPSPYKALDHWATRLRSLHLTIVDKLATPKLSDSQSSTTRSGSSSGSKEILPSASASSGSGETVPSASVSSSDGSKETLPSASSSSGIKETLPSASASSSSDSKETLPSASSSIVSTAMDAEPKLSEL